jgi:hypothetical protein
MGPDIRAVLAAHPRGLHAVVVDSAVRGCILGVTTTESAQSSTIPGSWWRLLPPGTPFLHFPHVNRRIQVNITTSPVPAHVHVPDVQSCPCTRPCNRLCLYLCMCL